MKSYPTQLTYLPYTNLEVDYNVYAIHKIERQELTLSPNSYIPQFKKNPQISVSIANWFFSSHSTCLVTKNV